LERLRQRADFLAATSATKVPTTAFVLQVRRRGEEGPVRVGFTVSIMCWSDGARRYRCRSRKS
jgi:ribonuclease P protein component